jgi:hypothetical protein
VLAANLVTVARARGADVVQALEDIPSAVREGLQLDMLRLEEALGRAAEEYGRIRGSFDLTRGRENQ